MPQVKKAFATADAAVMMAQLAESGATSIEVGGESISLDNEDIEVRLSAKDGWAAAQGAGVVVVLATELTPELVRAGYSRDLVRFVQDRRKELDLERTDRIKVVVAMASDDLKKAIEENSDYVSSETLATSLDVVALADAPSGAIEKEIGEHTFKLHVAKA